MKPIVINITNLIGTMIIVGDKESTALQIQENIAETLMKVLATVKKVENQESRPDKNGSRGKES